MKFLLLSSLLMCVFSLNAQIVNIPDANFKAVLVGDASINTNNDGEIQVTEANAFTGSIICFSQGISDLTGIEAFINLTELNCVDNQLTSLNVSQNTSLTSLSCGINQLTSLDVSQNVALTELFCEINQLTSLDVSQNTALTSLFPFVNQLTTLDVTQNTALTDLGCAANLLSTLNVSQNTALTQLSCSENELLSLDISLNVGLTQLYCNDNQLTSLSVSQQGALTNFSCKNNQLECLSVKNGNNSNFIFFSASGNANLNCIEVDDPVWASANLVDIDNQTSFSSDCENLCSSVGISELSNTTKQLVEVTDVMGRKTEDRANSVLIYIYSDGTTERVFNMQQ